MWVEQEWVVKVWKGVGGGCVSGTGTKAGFSRFRQNMSLFH